MVDVVDFFAKVAALAAAYVAFRGLYTWRRDFIGRRQLELAEDALVMFYKARDAIAAIRSPMTWGGEVGALERDDGESDFQFQSRQTVAPVFKRSESYSELFAEIEAMRYRYMARFGEGAAKPFEDMVRLRIRILLKARHYAQFYSVDYGPHDGDAIQRQKAKRDEAESYFWPMDDNGPVETEIARIMKEIEAQARGVMLATVADSDPVLRWFASRASAIDWLGAGRRVSSAESSDAATVFDVKRKP
ncbi:hypothetical protein [Pandoraea pnomenusa]|uniref:hypothetical protein n=1 Tax=Pandoraea pnomenusa TaxID=93220 RepID=UPI00333FB9B9